GGCTMNNEDFSKDMERLESRQLTADEMYYLFDITFWVIASAVVAVLSNMIPIERIIVGVMSLFC
ncbi:hypothetical protein J6D24_02795, partial [Candidatus Saccharibacteria bacterium]|nr:hypothetical protein [Candidatus Saccharibacteria bacterium]